MRGMVGCRVAMVVGLAMVCGRGMAQKATVTGWPSVIPYPEKTKVLLVTMTSPEKKQSCRDVSINDDAIECAVHGKKKVVYQRSEIVAIIAPAERSRWYLYFSGFLSGSGGAFWGSVVMAPVCIPCSVVLAVTGTILFLGAPATAMGDDADHPERVIYRKEGEILKVRLQ